MSNRRLVEINSQIDSTMQENDIPNTTENRLIMMMGLADAWKECPTPDDPAQTAEKFLYEMTLAMEIRRLSSLMS